jgi:HEPN domain-containing protein
MPEREKVVAVVREWVAKAENDLKNATHTLKLGEDCPTDTVCFHAQQCVEKYLKAFLVLTLTDFPKTHDIGEIVAMLPAGPPLDLSAEQQRELTRYATGARYPFWPDIPLREARHAVALAKRVRRDMRKRLPKSALDIRR